MKSRYRFLSASEFLTRSERHSTTLHWMCFLFIVLRPPEEIVHATLYCRCVRSHTEEVKTHLEMASTGKVHTGESVEHVGVLCVLTTVYSPWVNSSLPFGQVGRMSSFMPRIQIDFLRLPYPFIKGETEKPLLLEKVLWSMFCHDRLLVTGFCSQCLCVLKQRKEYYFSTTFLLIIRKLINW